MLARNFGAFCNRVVVVIVRSNFQKIGEQAGFMFFFQTYTVLTTITPNVHTST
jgi:hypothetical protein